MFTTANIHVNADYRTVCTMYISGRFNKTNYVLCTASQCVNLELEWSFASSVLQDKIITATATEMTPYQEHFRTHCDVLRVLEQMCPRESVTDGKTTHKSTQLLLVPYG